jgi:hypothetical protein
MLGVKGLQVLVNRCFAVFAVVKDCTTNLNRIKCIVTN